MFASVESSVNNDAQDEIILSWNNSATTNRKYCAETWFYFLQPSAAIIKDLNPS